MPGDGTRTAITKSNPPPPARLLDLTRLTSRAGRVLTGIDRVEYAYARILSRQDVPCFGLLRSRFGVILVPPERLWPVIHRICHGKRCKPDVLSRLARGKSLAQREAETEVRRVALARGRVSQLKTMLLEHLPSGFSYINVGHSNLDARVFKAVHGATGRSAVMVHDVIPLEYPDFQRAGTTERFATKMQAVRAHADLVLYTTKDTRMRCEAMLGQWGRVPPGVVAWLGMEPSKPATHDRSQALPDSPYFVALGTIEPRKNIGFLLDLWDEMGSDAPGLVICGARGWRNEEVFERLDARRNAGNIHEWNTARDAARDALIAGARGLLFPSHAEGFGLPAIEAARAGIPVICNPLAVFREILQDIPTYVSVKEPYLWINEIKKLADTAPGLTVQNRPAPFTWESHFKTVLSMI